MVLLFAPPPEEHDAPTPPRYRIVEADERPEPEAEAADAAAAMAPEQLAASREDEPEPEDEQSEPEGEQAIPFPTLAPMPEDEELAQIDDAPMARLRELQKKRRQEQASTSTAPSVPTLKLREKRPRGMMFSMDELRALRQSCKTE